QSTPGVATAKAPADKDTLVVVQGGDISKLDPQLSTQVNDITVSFNIFDNLTARDPDLNLKPGLATEWKTTSDTTWEFKLRPNVKFHNGDPFTSADVKFSIETVKDVQSGSINGAVYKSVSKVDVVDDLTVNMVTSQPDPLLPARHSSYRSYILP